MKEDPIECALDALIERQAQVAIEAAQAAQEQATRLQINMREIRATFEREIMPAFQSAEQKLTARGLYVRIDSVRSVSDYSTALVLVAGFHGGIKSSSIPQTYSTLEYRADPATMSVTIQGAARQRADLLEITHASVTSDLLFLISRIKP